MLGVSGDDHDDKSSDVPARRRQAVLVMMRIEPSHY